MPPTVRGILWLEEWPFPNMLINHVESKNSEIVAKTAAQTDLVNGFIMNFHPDCVTFTILNC